MADDSITAAGEDEATDDADAFDMANLSPAITGLPMVIWVSERGGARHDVRVRVSAVHGRNIRFGQWAVVAVRPRLVHGRLSPSDFAVVSDWIQLNEAALVDYWDYALLTDELMQRLRRLP
jgi:hypothetical protein